MTPQHRRATDTHDPVACKAVARALGEELRRAREEQGWSRLQLVARLPSGIGERTLLSYEAGSRAITVQRFIELCQALGVSPSSTMTMALQRARIRLENLVLLVDLAALLNDDTVRYRPLRPWARNKLRRQGHQIAEVPPTVVDELADLIGCDNEDLANHLATFIPDEHPPADDIPEKTVHTSLPTAAR